MVFHKLLWALVIAAISLSLNAQVHNIDGLYVNTFGEPQNQTLIFIHGGPGYNSFDFEVTTAKELSAHGFFVVVYDQRGQGRSVDAVEADFNYKTYAHDLKTIIDYLGINSPVLLGHSHGGVIAINFDRHYPKLAKAIVLIAAPLNARALAESIFENCSQKYRASENYDALNHLIGVHDELLANSSHLDPKLPFLVHSLFMHGGMCGLYDTSHPTARAEELRKIIHDNPISDELQDVTTALPGFLRNEDLAARNYHDDITSNEQKYFGVYGAEDGLFSEPELQRIEDSLQASGDEKRFWLVNDSSHSIFLDQQDEFFRLIANLSQL